jgi:hypothetical protein
MSSGVMFSAQTEVKGRTVITRAPRIDQIFIDILHGE